MMPRFIRNFVSSVAHRTTKRYNVLKIPSLSSQYWDKDEILLHAVMTLVVDFVEIECSFMEIDAPFTIREKLWLRLPWFLRSDNLIRSRERGLKHLDALISIYEDSMKGSSGHPRTIRDAYIWWKDIRPQKMRDIEEMNKTLDINDETDVQHIKSVFRKIDKLEAEVEKQDTKVLKRIVEARTFMWT